jgi:heat shock protein HslJ
MNQTKLIGGSVKMKRALFLLAFLLLSPLLPVQAQAPEGQEYVVQADDWLSKVAEKTYGDPLAYQDIVESTNAKAAEDSSFVPIDNPDVIEVGQKLWLPGGPGSSDALDSSATTPAAGGNRLSVDQLKNATYSGIYDTPVTLTNGLYEGAPFLEGGAARPTVQYIDNSEAYGDLDGNGAEDAALLLVENSGGSGVFTYVGSQLNQAGQPVDAGTVMMGDRTQIISMVIENNQVVVEMVTQGPDDPMCCPTQVTRKTLTLQDGKLTEAGAEATGTVSLDMLMGTSWSLKDFNFDQQPPLAETEITATFAEGQIDGSAGCNAYNGPVSSEGGQSLSIGPLASTQMACPEEIMNQETQYLNALQNASQWSYVTGQLAITYLEEEAYKTLLFTPAQSAATAATPETTPPESNDMDSASPTQVITFSPTAIPAEKREGSCFTSAVGLGREDAYRCMVGNEIYDPCFVVNDVPTVVCGANPTTGDIGFVLALTEPLPAPETGTVAKPWLIELPDGQVCGLMTGTVPGVEDRIAPYGCPDGSYLFEDFQQGEIWMAEKAVIGLNDDGFFVEQSEMVPIKTVWQ